MQVSQNVSYKNYALDVHNQQNIDIEHGSRGYYIPPNSSDEATIPQDVFVKSEHLQRLERLGDYIRGGFTDAASFMSMANMLHGENILNSQDLIAARYLARTSDDINFESFNKILKNESLSMEMRGLINQLINKLYNINYIHAGVMMAS